MADKIIKAIQQAHEEYKSGQGRGNWGHAGRPGQIGGSSPAGGGGGVTDGINPEYSAMQSVANSLRLGKKNRVGRYTTSRPLADIVEAATEAGYNYISSKTEPVVSGGTLKVTRTKLGYGNYATRGMSVTTYESGDSDIQFGSL